jgi:hypothetical protein
VKKGSGCGFRKASFSSYRLHFLSEISDAASTFIAFPLHLEYHWTADEREGCGVKAM